MTGNLKGEFEKSLSGRGARKVQSKGFLGSRIIDIIVGDELIYDEVASCCVITILYDRENKITAMVHGSTPAVIKSDLKKTIGRMRHKRANNIVAVTAGGGVATKAGKINKESRENIEAAHDVLNELGIERFVYDIAKGKYDRKKGGCAGLEGVRVIIIAFDTKTGMVEYLVRDEINSETVSGEFVIGEK